MYTYNALPVTEDLSLPGHCSDGDNPDHELLSIQAWRDCSTRLAAKLTGGPADGFIEVTRNKRRPRKDYSGQPSSMTTRLASGKIPRASFSRRFSRTFFSGTFEASPPHIGGSES